MIDISSSMAMRVGPGALRSTMALKVLSASSVAVTCLRKAASEMRKREWVTRRGIVMEGMISGFEKLTVKAVIKLGTNVEQGMSLFGRLFRKGKERKFY